MTNKERRYLSLKQQFGSSVGFIVLFCGLFFQFASEIYPMFTTFKTLFIIVDSLGCCIIVLSVFSAFYKNRTNLSERRKQLMIETSLTFTFNLSLQAIIFHILFYFSFPPVNVGIFFLFTAYFFFFVGLFNLTNALFRKYYVAILIAISLASIETVLSGVFLTFTGASDPIVEQGVGLLFAGGFFVIMVIAFFALYPKWKTLLEEDEEKEDHEENEEDEQITTEENVIPED